MYISQSEISIYDNICPESADEAEAYTSLYDDNQYEEIQPEVKFEGLRSVKELLLKVTNF